MCVCVCVCSNSLGKRGKHRKKKKKNNNKKTPCHELKNKKTKKTKQNTSWGRAERKEATLQRVILSDDATATATATADTVCSMLRPAPL